MSIKNNLKKYIWIWIVGWLFIVGIFYYCISRYIHGKTQLPKVCSEDICFTVELARTAEERELGLMYRQAMSETHGMLFVFSTPDFHNFWMKDTLIPLDMIWINDQYKIVRILTADACKADPCPVYRPETYASYVLEINAGLAEKYGITEWPTLQFKHIR